MKTVIFIKDTKYNKNNQTKQLHDCVADSLILKGVAVEYSENKQTEEVKQVKKQTNKKVK